MPKPRMSRPERSAQWIEMKIVEYKRLGLIYGRATERSGSSQVMLWHKAGPRSTRSIQQDTFIRTLALLQYIYTTTWAVVARPWAPVPAETRSSYQSVGAVIHLAQHAIYSRLRRPPRQSATWVPSSSHPCKRWDEAYLNCVSHISETSQLWWSRGSEPCTWNCQEEVSQSMIRQRHLHTSLSMAWKTSTRSYRPAWDISQEIERCTECS